MTLRAIATVWRQRMQENLRDAAASNDRDTTVGASARIEYRKPLQPDKPARPTARPAAKPVQ
jgi:hypothetical protein